MGEEQSQALAGVSLGESEMVTAPTDAKAQA
jgi:hypothetical protein